MNKKLLYSAFSLSKNKIFYLFTFLLMACVMQAQTINVQGNAATIVNADATPSSVDHTDFGAVNLLATFTRTFTIQNTHLTNSLNLTGTPLVSITGTDAADFSVTVLPNTPVAASGSTTFQVTFTPSQLGLRKAILSIANNDLVVSKNPYVFHIQGTGSNAFTVASCESFEIDRGVWTAGNATVQREAVNISGSANSFRIINAEHATTSNLNLSPYEFVELSFDFRSTGFNVATQSFSVQFSDNAGTASYIVLDRKFWTTDFANGTAGTIRVRVNAFDYNFNAGTSRFRIQCESGNNARYINIDNVCVTGFKSAQQKIKVIGNTSIILNNATLAKLVNNTDFGRVNESSGTITKVFTIQNKGGSVLNLTGVPDLVSISGAHAADFAVTVIPASSVAVSGATNFEVTFNPSALGVRSATITIANDDVLSSPFVFAIQGTGTNGVETSALACQDFEVNSTNWSVPASSRLAYNVNNTATAIRLQNVESLSNSPSVDLSNLVSATISFDYKTEGYTGTEGFDVQYSENGGVAYTTLQSFIVGTHFNNDYTGKVSLTVTTAGYALNNNNRFRIISTGNATTDRVWVDNLCITGIIRPAIQVRGNATTILPTDLTPSLTDHTNFDAVNLGSTRTRTFTINNTGSFPLNISTLTLTGLNAADYSITTSPSGTVLGGASTTFDVTFTPSALGERSALINIATNDSQIPTFSYAIKGLGNNTVSTVLSCQNFEVAAVNTPWSGGADLAIATVNGSARGYRLTSNQVAITSNLNFDNYDAVDLTFDFRAEGYPAANGYRVEFSDNGGSTFTTLGQFLVGTNLTLLQSATKTFSVSAASYNFFGRNKQFRITSIGSTATHILYIDNVCITGYRNATSTIQVVGNTFPIPSGSLVTTLLNHTDFGQIDATGLNTSRTFTIRNLGETPLNLGAISITGAHASDFTITTMPSASIAAGATSNLVIQFTPSAVGSRIATVNIPNDNIGKDPYTFVINGVGTIGTPDLVQACADFDTTLGPWVNGGTSGTSIAYNVSGTPQSYRIMNINAATTANINLSTYETATITFDYNTEGFSGAEGFRVRFSDNAGASYVTLATYLVQTDFKLFERGVISLTIDDTGVAPYNFSLGTARFRIESIANANTDIVYTDNICITGIRKQTMEVTGNSTVIANGDKTANVIDHTDFGNVNEGASLTRTFTIQNTGGVHYNLTGTPLVVVSGVDASAFSVTALPAVTKINGQQSTTFQVTFNPTRLGTHLATLTIANDTALNNPYVFDIQGRGVNASTTLLNCEDFQVGNGVWTAARTAVNIAGSTHSWTRNTLQTGTTTAFDLSPYEFVEVTFNYRTSGYSNTVDDLEGFALQFKDHNNLTYFDIANYIVDTDFVNGVAGTITARINAKDFNFSGANEQFRFASLGDFGTDLLYIDNVCIHGFASTTPKINVRGNTNSVANGDTTPSLVNHTDFGFVYANASAVTRTFTIENKGGLPLTLSGAPLVAVTGPHASEFVVSVLPTSPVAANGTTTFQVQFTPTAEGLRQATLTITNNDSSNSTYTFDIQGTGVNGALVDVNCNDFEVDMGIWTWGGSRSATEVNSPAFSMIEPNASFVQNNTLLNLKDYTFASISFDYRTSGYSGTEGFRVAYSSDGGGSFTTLGTFRVGTDFSNGVLGVVSIGLPAAGNNFNSTEARFRIQSLGNTNNDRIYFDNLCVKGIPKEAIALKGNSVTIANNDFTPSLTDHTDFGDINTGSTLVRTFTIENIGGPTVNLTSVPIVQISGVDASSFTVTSQPAAAFVFGQQNRTFQVAFTPTRLGAHYAKITIANSTATDNPYIFDIQGRGVNASTAIVNCENFEVDSGIWSINRRSGTNINGSAFSYNLWQANTATSTNLNLSSYEFVEVTFNYRPENYTLDEGFSVEFKDNVSTSFVSLRDFTTDTGLINNVNQTVTIRIDSRDFNFNGGNNQIRISGATVNDNSLDRVFIDNLCVHGFNSTAPKINVRGNNNTVAHGSIAPSLINHSDFGYVYTQGAGLTHTFTIRNLGSTALNLTGAPLVSVTGVNAADFVVTALPSSPVAASATTTFQVRFIPGALGLRTATISIANNDTTKNPYTFAVQGTGVPGAVVDINCENFEVGQGIWTSAGSPDSGNQRLTYDVNGSAVAYRVRNGGFVNTNNVNLSNYGQAIVTFSYRTLGYTGTEGFRIRFSDNGGASYTTIATFKVNTHFVNGAVGIATAIVNANDYDFSLATARFRIESIGNSNNDRLHFDDICVSGVIKSSVQVEGNATVITNNNTTPSAAYGTDFGSVTQATSFVQTFTVRNPSLTTLNLTGSPRVKVSGVNAADFVVTAMPNAFVAALGTTTFQVTFTPSALALRRATITIDNDSGNDNPYVFDVFGRGVNVTSSVLNCEDFEVNSGIWAANRRVATNINGTPNTYRIRNIETGTTSNLDLRLYDFAELTFHYRTLGYQDGQGFAVLFSDNGGVTFTEIANYIADVNVTNGQAGTINLRVNASAYKFGGANCQFRFLGKSTSNRDVYIDNVCVAGYRSSTSKINVKGKGLIIVNGDLIPALSNHSDFGPAYQIGSGTVTRTFTVENIGNSVLNLTGSPRVTISGLNAADFAVTAQPAASLAVLGTSNFNIRFTPSALGVRTATVTILSDDPTRNPYTFTIQGTGVDGVVINADGNAVCNTFETGATPAPLITWSGGTTSTTSQVNAARSYTANTAQIMTSALFNLTNYRIATITFDYKTTGYSGNEGFNIQFSDDGGTNYYTIGTYDVSTNLTNGVKSTASITLTAADYVFTGANERFRVLSLGDANTDIVYIDDICITGITKSQIVVVGNSVTIAKDDFTPTTLDHTDFGNVTQPGNLVRTFRVNNTGGATLNFTATPRVQVTGVNASDFVVTTQPTVSVAGGSFTTFQVTFTPSAMGVRNALITINSDDDSSPSFVFAVTGKGVNAFTAQLNCEDYESSMGIWTGGTRQAVSVNGTTNSVRLQSLENTTSNNLNLTPYEFVEISFDYNAQNYLPGLGFAIDFSDDGGITYNTINTSLHNVDFTTGVSNTVVARVTYTDYDFTGNNERFRVRTTGNATTRFVNIDKVCVTGYISNEPKIVVRGNSLLISNNVSNPPSLINHTDFGQIYSGGGTIARTFTIQNIGGVALSLSGTPRVNITGTNASEFTVTTLPVVSVAGSSSTTFVVTFAPTTLGVRTATITIPSNDASIPSYVFAVQGTGTIGQLATISCQDFETDALPWLPSGVRQAYNVNGSPNALSIISNQNSITDYIDLSNYLTATMTFDYKTQGYTTGQGFRIDFLVGGASVVVKTLIVDNDFENLKRGIVSVTVSSTDFNFATPNNNRFRIVSLGSGGRVLNVDNVCISGVLKPSFRIEGNATTIVNNDLTPRTGDHTDFGNVTESTSFVRTFTVNNTGGPALNLTGTPRVLVSGANASEFVVTTLPNAYVPGLSTTTFQVTFTPTTLGMRTALITVANDNAVNNPYIFAIQGRGANASTTSVNCEDYEVSSGIWSSGAIQAYAVNHTPQSYSINFNASTATSNLNFNNYEFVELTFDYKTQGFTGGQTFDVRFSDNGGTSLNSIVKVFQVSNDFDNLISGTKTVRVSAKDFDFSGNDEIFTIKINGNNTARILNIDNVCITGYRRNSPIISVKANNLKITNGDLTPSLADLTNFGATYHDGGTVINTFVINNFGGAALNLTGTPRVQITGANAADFVVTTLPVTPVTASGSTTFQITFNPSAIGVRTATVTIASNDTADNPFTFSIKGEGVVGDITTLVCQDFENDLDPVAPWISGTATRQNYNVNGSAKAMRLEAGESLISDILNLDDYFSSTITFDFKTEGYTGTEGFRVYRSTSGGVWYLEMDELDVNVDFYNGVKGRLSVTVNAIDHPTFFSGANEIWRISSQGGAATDEVYIDNLCITGIRKQAIQVQGNSLPIANNDLTPATTDHTDFGNVNLGSTLVRTLAVANLGGPTLTLTGTPTVVISGPNAADFVVTTMPSSTIFGNTSSPLGITFTPSALGVREAIVTILNDDPKNPTYVFAIKGVGSNVSTVNVNCESFESGSGIWSSGVVMPFVINGTPQSIQIVNQESISSSNLDFSNYEFVELSFDYRGQGFSGVQTFDVQFSDNAATSSYIIQKTFQVDTNFTNTIPETAVVRVFAKDFDFTGNHSRFRIKVNGTAGRLLNIDNICIKGFRRDNPVIAVRGNELPIVNGDVTPSFADHTNFGNVYEGGATLVRTFTVRNAGGATLNLTGSPTIAVSGAHASDFVVTVLPSASLTASTETTFQVTFDPSSLGTRNATITIASNSIDNNPYVFNIQGIGLNNLINFVNCQGFETDATPWLASGTRQTYNVDGSVTALEIISNQTSITDYFDFTTYESVTLSFDYKTEGYTGTEGFRVRFFVAGTATTLQTYVVNTDFINGYKGSASITINASDFPPFTTNNKRFRIESLGNAITDKIYVDNVCIKGVVREPLEVRGNNTKIANGDIFPLANKHTDFETLNEREFTIFNTTGSPITITSIVATGGDAVRFGVSGIPPSIPGNSSATFKVLFSPIAVGAHNTTIRIVHSGTITPYDFSIRAYGIPPAIRVTGNAIDIASGSTTVSGLNNTYFGSVFLNKIRNKTFAIINSGTMPLSLSGAGPIDFGPGSSAKFTITSQPATTLVGNSTATFIVRYVPDVLGTHDATISIPNNAGATHTFAISGEGRDGVLESPGCVGSAWLTDCPEPSPINLAVGGTLTNMDVKPISGMPSLSWKTPGVNAGVNASAMYNATGLQASAPTMVVKFTLKTDVNSCTLTGRGYTVRVNFAGTDYLSVVKPSAQDKYNLQYMGSTTNVAISTDDISASILPTSCAVVAKPTTFYVTIPKTVGLTSGNLTFSIRETTQTTGFPLSDVRLYISDVEVTSDVASCRFLWLKANAGIATPTDGTPVARWSDQSAVSNHATQSVAGSRPVFKENVLNYNPAIQFSGSHSLLGESGFNSATQLVVFNRSVLTTSGSPAMTLIGSRLTDSDSDRSGLRIGGFSSSVAGEVYGILRGTTAGNAVAATGVTLKNGILTVQSNTNNPPTAWLATRNGVSESPTSGGTGYAEWAARPYVLGASVSNSTYTSFSDFYNGNLLEVLSYPTRLTTNELQRVQSYLAIKYGLTLGHDYLNGNGATIYNVSTHNRRIFGIGREDCQGLHQRQAKPESDNTAILDDDNERLLTIGYNGIIAPDNKATNGNDLPDQTFIVIGDDNTSVTVWTPTGAPTAAVIEAQRIVRSWKSQTTGTPVKTKVRLDGTKLPAITLVATGDSPKERIALVIASSEANIANATFNSPTNRIIPMNKIGSDWELDVVFSPNTTQYFTFIKYADCFEDLLCSGTTTTWTGSWDNGAPSATKMAVLASAYSTTANGNFSACKLVINTGIPLTINVNGLIQVQSDITNNGSITIENTGSLMQYYDQAVNSGAGSVSMTRSSTPMYAGDYTYWSSPVQGFNLSGISKNRAYYRDPVTNSWVRYDSGIMDSGKGYIVMTDNSSKVTPTVTNVNFTGNMFNGRSNVTLPISTLSSFSLVGNPYPSAIDADQFLLDNRTRISGGIYFWTHFTRIDGYFQYTSLRGQFSQSDYAIYTLTGGTRTAPATTNSVPPSSTTPVQDSSTNVLSYGGANVDAPTGYIAAGQAFFVGSIDQSTVQQIEFKNCQRSIALGTNDHFYKTSNKNNQKDRFWLDIMNEEGSFKQALIGYMPGATNELDNLFDATTRNGSNAVSVYTVLNTPKEALKMAIQGRSYPFNVTDKIPLGFSINDTGRPRNRINLSKVEGLFNDVEVYLQDKLTDTIHNLKKRPYDFVSQIGEYNDRFVILYENKPSTSEQDALLKGIIVSQSPGTINVYSKDTYIKSVTVYSTLGELLYTSDNLNRKSVDIKEIFSRNTMVVISTTLVNGEKAISKIIY